MQVRERWKLACKASDHPRHMFKDMGNVFELQGEGYSSA